MLAYLPEAFTPRAQSICWIVPGSLVHQSVSAAEETKEKINFRLDRNPLKFTGTFESLAVWSDFVYKLWCKDIRLHGAEYSHMLKFDWACHHFPHISDKSSEWSFSYLFRLKKKKCCVPLLHGWVVLILSLITYLTKFEVCVCVCVCVNWRNKILYVYCDIYTVRVDCSGSER